ncbi:MAG: sel1 repeat family protein [Proteobacteria bacterium]|nr:sel1 repeat family protein [Pseudomonadota bacterium]MBU1740783.1 sel1 repeat family protein [Pseudomonadota bacterium]
MVAVASTIGKLWLTLMLIASPVSGADKAQFHQALRAARAGNHSVAARIWQAQKGLPAAQFNLGVFFIRGRGVKKDPAKAAGLFKMAAQAGFAPGAHNLGVMLIRGKGLPANEAQGAKWLRIAADRGFAPSQLLLGKMMRRGKGVPRDKARGLKLIRAAATQNYPPALFELSLIHGRGKVTPEDRSKSIALMRRAAQAGFPEAMYYIGRLYERGRYMLQNFGLAHMWYNLAAVRDYPRAARRRDDLLQRRKMTPQAVARAQQRAMKWKPTVVYRPTFVFKPVGRPQVKKVAPPPKVVKIEPAPTPRAAVLAMFRAMAQGNLAAVRVRVTGKLTGAFDRVSADDLRKIKQAGRRFRQVDRATMEGDRAMVTVVVDPPVAADQKRAYFNRMSRRVIGSLQSERDPVKRGLLERRLHWLAKGLDLMGFEVKKQGEVWLVSRVLFGGK